MRGMIDGTWHPDIDATYCGSRDIAADFAQTVGVGIDLVRLRNRPESYHLYAAYACPFAHRALLGRALLGLDAIGVTECDPWLGGLDGWRLTGDGPVPGATRLWEVFAAHDTGYTGRVTVPVLWDVDAGAIASAESWDILRAMREAVSGDDGIRCPDPAMLAQCDAIKVDLNLAVYRAAFAPDQAAFDAAVDGLAATMAALDSTFAAVLGTASPSLADLLIFTTAVRFDAAYHGAFGLLSIRWRDHPNLRAHMASLLARPAIAATVRPADYRIHYFDDAAFPIRHPKANGRYLVPRTPSPFDA